ncbi:hypothetical protein DH2020_045467 [Rehmannia glutinosa]|uniref:Reverse transcriptase zinc-binding domain-containing protein n=1 Tax=Rehmannia glutinosa TaxID=99300 RepID=A0ABR0UFR7_REHGL
MNFVRHHKLDVIGVLETKLVEATLPKIMRTWFAGWKYTCNFHMHPNGRILVLWNPATVILEELDISPQVIHCAITCKVSSISLLASFIYGYHTVGSRKPLWDNLISFGENCSLPWIAIGDFNNVLNANEKCNGKDVTSHELKHFEECCVLTGDSPLLKRIFEIRDIIVSKEGTTELAIANLDRWFAGENSGCSKAYEYFRPRGTPKVWANEVWRHYIPPKHSFILWLGIKGRLQTKDRLHYMDIDQNCALCGTAPETLDHLFFQCNMTNQVWLQIKKWLCITRAMTTIKSALKYMKKEARGTSWQSCAKKSAVACTVYHIWTARNRRLFEGAVVTSDGITREIKTQVYKIMFSSYPHVLAQYEHLALGH